MLTGLNNINNVIFRGITPLKQSKACVSNSYVQSPLVKNVSFHGYNTVDVAKTQLTTPSELKAYTEVASSLDSEGKKALDYMLKTGSLLNNNSDDKSTTLDNLHKILLNDRASGLDKKGILNDTVKTIANPYGITQHFGNIPESMIGTLKQYDNSTEEVEHSGCCVAASIEFNLASQMPAEFARIAEGLSSPNMSVKKHLSLNTLCDNKEDSKWLLDNFKIPYTMTDENNVEVTIAPDKNAIFRAHIQTVDKDELERTPVDVLMQSTLMNIGSQQTYNTLNDTRVASFGPGDKGLVEIEKTFTESVVTNTNKTSVTFQDLRESVDKSGAPSAKLAGYRTDFNTIKRCLLNSLAEGKNVIIGYTSTDEDNNIVNGHEITVVGAKLTPDNKLIFVCNDTDDDKAAPVEYHEDYIIPKIHHVGLPTEIVEADPRLENIA